MSRYSRTDPSQTIGIDAAKRAGQGFEQAYSTSSTNARQADRLAQDAEQNQLDRESREKMQRQRLAALIGQKKPSEAAARRRQIEKRAALDAQRYEDALDQSNALERGIADVPYLGGLAGGLQSLFGNNTIEDLRRGKTGVAQAGTYLESGAAATEPEVERRKQSSFASPLSSLEEQREALNRTRSGLNLPGANSVDNAGNVEPPYGPTVQRNGKTYQWDPAKGKYVSQ